MTYLLSDRDDSKFTFKARPGCLFIFLHCVLVSESQAISFGLQLFSVFIYPIVSHFQLLVTATDSMYLLSLVFKATLCTLHHT